MYWAPGGVHGPHHIFPEWADKYKGKFDGGWDAYRERTYKRQLEMGVIPEGTELTPRDATMASWDSIPDEQRPFQERLMELFAGFVEHTDTEVGRLIDGMEAAGCSDNTLIFYIFGDNGSSAEGQQGSISELLAQNNIANTVEQQIDGARQDRRADALGAARTDNMYHAGWAWAGGTPFKGTKLMASYFGGTRNPMVVSWPGHIKHDGKMRQQFHHVIDIAPTIYDVLNIPAPKVVNGYEQMPIDGVEPGLHFRRCRQRRRRRTMQFFDNNGSRGIYADGWFAGCQGPVHSMGHARLGQASGELGLRNGPVGTLRSELGFLAGEGPRQQESGKTRELKKRFLEVAEENKDFPIGAGNWLRFIPRIGSRSAYDEWTFGQTTAVCRNSRRPASGARAPG